MSQLRLKSFLIFLATAVLMSCSASHDSNDSNDSNDSTSGYIPNPNPNPQLAVAAQGLLENKCQSCHGPGGTSTSFLSGTLSDLASNPFYIKIGEPGASNIYLRASDGSMPAAPQSPLTESELKTLEDWIADLGVFNEGVSSEEPVTFTQVWTTTFGPKCSGCHGVANPPADISIKNYSDLQNLINISVPESSLVYDALISNRMPKNNPSNVSDEEKEDILIWIQQGGLDN